MRMHRRGSSENLGGTGICGKLISEQRPEGVRAGPWRGLGEGHPRRGRHTVCPRTGTGPGPGRQQRDRWRMQISSFHTIKLQATALSREEEFHAWIPVRMGRTEQKAEEEKVNLDCMGTDGDGVCKLHLGDGVSG